jgi:O-antigen ligase
MLLTRFNINLFTIGLIMCFLLPPIGILLLNILGLKTIYHYFKNKLFRFSLLHCYFISIFLSSIGATLQMHNPKLLFVSFMILCYFGVYLTIIENKEKSMINFQTFKWITIFGGIYNCIVGWFLVKRTIPPAIGFLTGTEIFGVYANDDRLVGSAYNPNFTMYFLLLALAFVLYELLFCFRSSNWKKIIWFLGFGLILTKGIVDTGSRAAFIAMLFIFALFLFQLNKKIFSLIFLVFLFNIHRIFSLMPRSSLIDTSYNVREIIWKNSIILWEHHPIFGVTPLGFHDEYNRLFPNPIGENDVPHAHNFIIGAFAEYGTFSGIIYSLLLIMIVVKMVTMYFNREKNDKNFELFLFSLPVLFLTGILDEPNFSPQVFIVTVILLSYWEKYTNMNSSLSINFSYLLSRLHLKSLYSFEQKSN